MSRAGAPTGETRAYSLVAAVLALATLGLVGVMVSQRATAFHGGPAGQTISLPQIEIGDNGRLEPAAIKSLMTGPRECRGRGHAISDAFVSYLRSLTPGWAARRSASGLNFFSFMVQQSLAYWTMACKRPHKLNKANFPALIHSERDFVFRGLLAQLPSFDQARGLFPTQRGAVFTCAKQRSQLDQVHRTLRLLAKFDPSLPAEVWSFDGAPLKHKLCGCATQ
jgi:hypothetical protein